MISVIMNVLIGSLRVPSLGSWIKANTPIPVILKGLNILRAMLFLGFDGDADSVVARALTGPTPTLPRAAGRPALGMRHRSEQGLPLRVGVQRSRHQRV